MGRLLNYDEFRQLVLDWLDDHCHFGDAATLVCDDDMSFLDNGLSRENFDSMRRIITYVTGHPQYQGAWS